MLLAIDIGNTNSVFGIHDSGKWLNYWRIQTDPLKTADEYEVIFRSLITSGEIYKSDIQEIVLCSVVPSLVGPFTEMLVNMIGKEPLIVGPDIYPKLPLKILNPYQIGADLVANAVAAYSKYGGITMVIDFGTALTFTTIGSDGEILGVAIAPGLKTAISSLAGNTAQLPFVHLSAPPSVLGKNTVHAIQSGVVLGYCGLVDSIINRTRDELKTTIMVVATGGLSSQIAPLSKNIDAIEKLLTLDGLKLISGLA